MSNETKQTLEEALAAAVRATRAECIAAIQGVHDQLDQIQQQGGGTVRVTADDNSPPLPLDVTEADAGGGVLMARMAIDAIRKLGPS
jgi:predicted NUDIX family NTP pyrophosphohydrolase